MAWEPLPVPVVARLLAGAAFPWWICGGWAIDLFLGKQTRTHGDVEVGVLRGDQCALYALLEAFEVHAARDGVLTELTPEQRANGLPRGHHGFWCRRRGGESWALELLLDEGEGGDWVFRRDERIRRPVREVVSYTRDGIPFLVPEVQLLFKAKARRPRDEADFANARAALSDDQRAWLRDALGAVHPGHDWIARLG